MASTEADEAVSRSTLYNPRPRVVFISFYYFSLNWDLMPGEVLYNAICVFTSIKRSWVFNDDGDARSKWRKYIQGTTEQFIDVICLKERQGLLFWQPESHGVEDNDCCIDDIMSPRLSQLPSLSTDMSNKSVSSSMKSITVTDDEESGLDSDGFDSVTPCLMWWRVSVKLARIRDPLTCKCYQPLCTDMQQWAAMGKEHVIRELLTGDGNFEAISEIIEYSNPNLTPMINFDRQLYMNKMSTDDGDDNTRCSDGGDDGDNDAQSTKDIMYEFRDKYGFTHLLYEYEYGNLSD